MDQEQSGHGGGDAAPEPGDPSRPMFPKHAVVGVIDTREEASRAVEALRAAGFENVSMISGEHALELIDETGSGHGLSGRLTRMMQGLFGMEVEHTERHVAEVEAGHVLVLASSHDDETTDRIRDVLAAHGGHFVNYYTSWTSRLLIP